MKNCKACNKILRGRSDKKYCSIHCKNIYHQRMRQENASVVTTIDRFLHRNRIILHELLLEHNLKRLTVSKIKLQKMGFRFSNITGIYINSKGKTYHYVYDYSWMEFSTNDVMIIKRKDH